MIHLSAARATQRWSSTFGVEFDLYEPPLLVVLTGNNDFEGVKLHENGARRSQIQSCDSLRGSSLMEY